MQVGKYLFFLQILAGLIHFFRDNDTRLCFSSLGTRKARARC